MTDRAGTTSVKPPIVIERGTLKDGGIAFRTFCPACRVHGAWLRSLVDCERNAALHLRKVHDETAVA